MSLHGEYEQYKRRRTLFVYLEFVGGRMSGVIVSLGR